MTAAAARRAYGPVLLAGLAAGALSAVAGSRDWAVGTAGRVTSTDEMTGAADAGQMPLAAALALVVLACWGVVIVSRGLVRRLVAGLAVLASAGLLITCAVGWSSAPESVVDALSVAVPDASVEVSRTGWYAVACVAAAASLVTTVLAAWLAPGWPEMGRRYDAPDAQARTAVADAADPDASSLDMWKSLDEGHDPTARDAGSDDYDDPGRSSDTRRSPHV